MKLFNKFITTIRLLVEENFFVEIIQEEVVQ